MPEIIITTEQLASLTGQTPEAITTAITTDDGGIDAAKAFTLLSQGVSSKIKKRGEDQYQAAWKARSQSLESVIKEKFGITEFENAEAALEAAAAMLEESKKAGSGKFDPAKLTPEQLAGIPAFTTATEKLRGALELTTKERDAALGSFVQYRTMQTAKAKAEAILDEKKAHYGSAGKDRALSLLFTDLQAQGFNLTSDEGGNLSILDKENKPALDEYHNPLRFEALVEKTWPFGFNAADPGQNPNPAKPGGTGGGAGGGDKYAAMNIEALRALAQDPALPTGDLAKVMGALADKQRQK